MTLIRSASLAHIGLITLLLLLLGGGNNNVVVVNAEDTCEHPVDHNLFELGREVHMSIKTTKDPKYGYLKIEFGDDGGIYKNITGIGWCVDLSRAIGKGQYEVDAYSTYDSVSIPNGAVDKPQNLDVINWLVNNYVLGQWVDPAIDFNDPNCKKTKLSWREIQKAIWTIIDTGIVPGTKAEQCVVDHIVNDALLNGDGFEPCCEDNEKMAALLVVDDDSTGTNIITHQVMVVEIILNNVNNACPIYSGGNAQNRPPPGAMGDPHFKTWSGELYDFHGICDLVLLHNPNYYNGLGMDIHIRTKKTLQWSYISNVGIQIGNDGLGETFEVMGDSNQKTTRYWINGVEGSSTDSIMKLNNKNNGELIELLDNSGTLGSGLYTIQYKQMNKQQKQFIIQLNNNNDQNNEQIIITVWKNKMIRIVIVNATMDNFGTSLGLMGTYKDGIKLGRDGKTIMNDDTSLIRFGKEWQVKMNESKIFHNIEGPQAPEHCDIPSKSTIRRRLGQSIISKEQATKICTNNNIIADPEQLDLCIFDVMVSNDITMASAYNYIE